MTGGQMESWDNVELIKKDINVGHRAGINFEVKWPGIIESSKSNN